MASDPNPYQTPLPVDPTFSWWDRFCGWWRISRVVDQEPAPKLFANGHAIIFGGIAYFVDPKDADLLYAASPSSVNTDQRMQLIVQQAIEILPEFVADFPALAEMLGGRRLVVRMIVSYHDDQASFLNEVSTDEVVVL